MTAPSEIVATRSEPLPGQPGTPYLRVGKRVLGVAAALAGLTITSPLFLLCAVAIPFTSPGPIFFRQVRIGRYGVPFRIFKFRSMVCGSRGSRVTAAGDPRVTRLGKWLRRTKLDEIPQLINVLRGEMSVVGPRPEVPEYVATYSARQRRVLEMKPGITGPAALRFVDEEELLARASHRDEFYVSRLLPHKLELELAYCEQMNLWSDLRLIVFTALRLFRRQSEIGLSDIAG